MGAANPANPQNETGSDKPPEGSVLLWLAKSGPPWARIPAICAGLLVAVVPTLLLVANWIPPIRRTSVAEAPTATQLQMGVSVQLANARAKLEDKLKGALTADDKQEVLREFDELNHQIGHLSNPVDEAVKWTVFEKKASGDYWGYRLLPSDGCLLVTRVENGSAMSQWVRDPLRAPVPPQPPVARLGVRNGFTVPNLQAVAYRSAVQRLDPFHEQGPIQLQQMQGSCVNPHPWPYQESWGPYINQCQQPVYRRWNDGCTHVQMFDHCQNVWGPVVWQFCAANHHP